MTNEPLEYSVVKEVPIYDIPMMSDETWHKLADNQKVDNNASAFK